jgi:hypothetical protein
VETRASSFWQILWYIKNETKVLIVLFSSSSLVMAQYHRKTTMQQTGPNEPFLTP